MYAGSGLVTISTKYSKNYMYASTMFMLIGRNRGFSYTYLLSS